MLNTLGRSINKAHKVAATANNAAAHLRSLSTGAFALAVAEEFLILAVIAFLAVEFQYITCG